MSKRKGTIMMAGGLLLVAAALLLTGYNLWDEHRAGVQVSMVLEQIEPEVRPTQTSQPEIPQEVEIPDYILDPKRDMPVVEIDGKQYIGTLEIPALELKLPVISEWSYSNLKIAPCRYGGSAYLGDLIIAAHNYRSHFGSLRKLQPDDEVFLTDVDGNVFRYAVVELETLNGGDVEGMEAGDWDLTLFTCTLGGKTRVTVRCQQIEGEATAFPEYQS